jgi:hypothetical protein
MGHRADLDTVEKKNKMCPSSPKLLTIGPTPVRPSYEVYQTAAEFVGIFGEI